MTSWKKKTSVLVFKSIIVQSMWAHKTDITMTNFIHPGLFLVSTLILIA